MPPVIRPEELARVVEAAERARAGGWSLRAALTRYAQPQPTRASQVIELVRRIEAALRPHRKLLEKEGDRIWAEMTSDDGSATDADPPVPLLRALAELDRLADVLATWAVDRQGERPDAAVDAVVADVAGRLEALGVPHEERPRPSGRPRSRG